MSNMIVHYGSRSSVIKEEKANKTDKIYGTKKYGTEYWDL